MASVTFSIRIDDQTLQRIDQAAEAAGETRSTYILSWVPACYTHEPSSNGSDTQSGAGTGEQR